MELLELDSKQRAIFESAWTAFSSYGFRKTSMDDIARGANMSRPALYLHYKNKEAIFCSLIAGYYKESALHVQAALAGDGPLGDCLHNAFVNQGGLGMKTLLTSPHGSEFLEAVNSVAAAEIAEGEADLSRIYAEWLSELSGQKKVKLPASAEACGAAIIAALKGAKTTARDYDRYVATLQTLAAMFAQGLRP